ncbi:MAG: hypothetical protein JW913_04790 [Chitinispirillaceae bacterium]|nr:hypothetical protein [Chitinispirillaceae bacterium]
MKERFPASLVQIHYHDRPGGVRRVMDDYSAAFSRIAGHDAPNFRVCCRSGDRRYLHSSGIDLPAADYHVFRTRQSYQRSVETLTGRLMRIFMSLPLRFPAAIIGHNLNLGKNPALSAAFAGCARILGGGDNRYRFFSMMHDFAEAGRIDLLRRLRRLTEQGIDSYHELYAAGAPVHFIVPNQFSAQLSGLKEKEITVLPHPAGNTVHTIDPLSSGEIRAELRLLARRDGLRFDPGRKLYFFPSRMIYRKNILEALLVAAVLLDGSLVTGACGRTAADRRRMSAAMRIARQYGLSLAIDPSRLPYFRKENSGAKERNPFSPLYPGVDCILTTSLAEGFGYSLVEPWAYGRPVIGRRPAGISLPPGMESAPLYDRFPVPCSWVDVEECYRRFVAGYYQAFGKRYVPLQSFRAVVVREETIDFGMLDDRRQADILTRILRCDADRGILEALANKPAPGWPGMAQFNRPDARLINRMQNTVRGWSDDRFDDAFVKCLTRRTLPAVSRVWYRRIAAFYRRTRNFRLISPVHLSNL